MQSAWTAHLPFHVARCKGKEEEDEKKEDASFLVFPGDITDWPSQLWLSLKSAPSSSSSWRARTNSSPARIQDASFWAPVKDKHAIWHRVDRFGVSGEARSFRFIYNLAD